MRDSLIDIITTAIARCSVKRASGETVDNAAVIADALIEKGVIVPPCKVGDTVYAITNCENILMYHDNDYYTGTGAIECPFENSCNFEECDDSNLRIFETRVVTTHCEEGFGWTFWCAHIHKDFMFSEIGKTVFLTREEAEQALKGADDEQR